MWAVLFLLKIESRFLVMLLTLKSRVAYLVFTYWLWDDFLKFIYSEKATKFCQFFPLLLTVCTVVKSKGKIWQNFVAFLEYMSFTIQSNTGCQRNSLGFRIWASLNLTHVVHEKPATENLLYLIYHTDPKISCTFSLCVSEYVFNYCK